MIKGFRLMMVYDEWRSIVFEGVSKIDDCINRDGFRQCNSSR